MGAGRLRVDLDALVRLAGAADDVAGRLGDLHEVEEVPGVGAEVLDGALRGFTGRWGTATNRSRRDVEGLAARLVTAHQVYQRMDADLAAATRSSTTGTSATSMVQVAR